METHSGQEVRYSPPTPNLGSWELHVADRRLVVSDDAARVIGVESPAVLGSLDTLFARAHQDDVAALRAALERAIRGEAALDVEFRVGDARLHLCAGRAVPSSGGAPTRIWGTVQDVSGRPRISHVLRESDLARADAEDARAQAARILESVSDGFAALDRHWCYTHANVHAARLVGRTPAEMIGTSMWTDFPPGSGPEFLNAYRRAMQEREFVFLEAYYAPLDRWFENRIHPTDDGIAIFFHDITDRKRADERRRESEAQVRQLANTMTTTLESITDAFYTLDREWRFSYVNHEAERLMVHGRDQLLDRSVWEVFPDAIGTQFYRQFLRAAAENVVVKFEDYYPPLSRWFEVRAFPSAQGLAVYFLDVTERRQTADAVRAFNARLESVQDAERASLARELHDELGQSLTVLRMDATRLTRMVAADTASTGLVQEMTQVIDSTLQRARSIALALHPTALEDVGLADALEIHVSHVVRRAGLVATLALAPVSARVDLARARAVYRVAQESLTNVIRHASATEVTVRLTEGDASLVLQVEDNGCGIAAEQRPAASLGLLGMRERAVAFGGTVVVARREPRGTMVTLTLPLAPVDA